MTERRRLALAALLVVAAVPAALALSDRHLAGASTALTVSTTAGSLAVSALVAQPLLAARGRLRPHQALGGVALALVAIHVGALFLESPQDARFALSPDGPTRARMALFATVALVAVVSLGVLRRRLPLAPSNWRILHGYLAAVVIALGFGHAILTDGALDGPGTPVLLAFGAGGLLGVAAAFVARARRR